MSDTYTLKPLKGNRYKVMGGYGSVLGYMKRVSKDTWGLYDKPWCAKKLATEVGLWQAMCKMADLKNEEICPKKVLTKPKKDGILKEKDTPKVEEECQEKKSKPKRRTSKRKSI